jgi:hypothetical protein
MEHLEWSRKEARLYSAVMAPRRTSTSLRGVPRKEVKRRAKLRAKTEKERELAFAAEWRAYRDWINHLPGQAGTGDRSTGHEQ